MKKKLFSLAFMLLGVATNTIKAAELIEPQPVIDWEKHLESCESMAYGCFGNIGYRRQSKIGFVFRAGLSPVFGFGGNTVEGCYFLPYLGLGWSF